MRGLQYRGLCFVLIARIGKAFFGLFVLPSLFYSLARFGFVCVCVYAVILDTIRIKPFIPNSLKVNFNS